MPTNPAAPTSLGATNARGGGPPVGGDVAVISTIQAGKDIAGDGSGYTNSSILQSVIASNGDDAQWYLDLRNSQNTRTVHLNFTGNGIAGTGPPTNDLVNPPVNPGSGDYKVWMYTPCNTGNYDVNMLEMENGPLNAKPCPMAVWFETSGKRYLLRMNSYADGVDVDDVLITRLVEGTVEAPVTRWQIRPSDGVSNRARLFYQGKGNTGLVKQGDYNMSFAIDLTTP
jgi:hypothetical protein